MLPSCFAEAKMKLLKPVVCFILNSWGINVSFALTWNYVILNHKCCSATIQRALSKKHAVTREVMTQKKDPINVDSLSLFHMKITVSVAKSSHQDCGPCYLHLPIFFLYIHSPLLLENKKLWCLLFSSAN